MRAKRVEHLGHPGVWTRVLQEAGVIDCEKTIERIRRTLEDRCDLADERLGISDLVADPAGDCLVVNPSEASLPFRSCRTASGPPCSATI